MSDPRPFKVQLFFGRDARPKSGWRDDLVNEMCDWCDQNVTGAWTVSQPRRLAYTDKTMFNFSFEDQHSATLFKLFHGGDQ